MIIKLEDVNYIYNPGTVEEVTAVSDANLELGGDSFTAIIGSTGSGKSTLIQMLNGLLEPASGQITYDGVPIYKKGKLNKEEKKALRQLRCRVGLVFQYPEYQLFEETVYKDIAYGPRNMKLSEEEIDRRVCQAAKFAGLSDAVLQRSPFELSGGQKRRVAIAGVIAMEPKVLILDEPTAGLDPAGAAEILETESHALGQAAETLKNILILYRHAQQSSHQIGTGTMTVNDLITIIFDERRNLLHNCKNISGRKNQGIDSHFPGLLRKGSFHKTDQ